MTTTETSQSPPVPSSKRHWRIAFVIAALAVIGAIVHLFWPISPPPHALLAYMPEDMAAGIELRDASGLWNALRNDGSLEGALNTPLVESLSTITAERDVDLRTILRGSIKRVDNQLVRSSIASRALSGSVAVAFADPQGQDAAVIARIDNLSFWILRAAIAVQGKMVPQHDIPQCIVRNGPGGRSLTITLHNGLLVAATNPRRIMEIIQRLDNADSPPALMNRSEFPPQSILVHTRPNQAFREAMHQHIGTAVWTAEEAIATITRPDKQIALDSTCRLRRQTMQASLDAALDTTDSSTSVLPSLITLDDLPPAAAPGAGGVTLRGWIAPRFLWHSLSMRLWDEPARPMRGDSRPATVFLWDLIDSGIVPHADGHLVVRLQPTPEDRRDPVVPAAPELAAAWGVRGIEAEAISALERPTRNLVEWYASPGGPKLYEQVRAATEVERVDEHTMRVMLHPLFFNHQQIHLESRPGSNRVSFGNHARIPELPTLASFTQGSTDAKIGHFAAIDFAWDSKPQFIEDILALLEDKLIKHAFVAEEEHPVVRHVLALFEATAMTLKKGNGRILLERSASPGRLDNDDDQFLLHLTVRVGF